MSALGTSAAVTSDPATFAAAAVSAPSLARDMVAELVGVLFPPNRAIYLYATACMQGRQQADVLTGMVEPVVDSTTRRGVKEFMQTLVEGIASGESLSKLIVSSLHDREARYLPLIAELLSDNGAWYGRSTDPLNVGATIMDQLQNNMASAKKSLARDLPSSTKQSPSEVITAALANIVNIGVKVEDPNPDYQQFYVKTVVQKIAPLFRETLQSLGCPEEETETLVKSFARAASLTVSFLMVEIRNDVASWRDDSQIDRLDTVCRRYSPALLDLVLSELAKPVATV
jgi:hypothetical protein